MTSRPAPDPAPEPPDDAFDGDPDHAWKALSLVIDWIKHAETKAGTTLAASGITGGVLYNLIKNEPDPGPYLGAAAVLCALAVLAAGASAAMAFLPRLGDKADHPDSPLYFKHIAAKHPRKPHTYFEDLHRLTASAEDLVREIAEQVWANSQVAARKYAWASRAVTCLVVALTALSVATVILGWRSLEG